MMQPLASSSPLLLPAASRQPQSSLPTFRLQERPVGFKIRRSELSAEFVAPIAVDSRISVGRVVSLEVVGNTVKAELSFSFKRWIIRRIITYR
jgi:hypothetical protein